MNRFLREAPSIHTRLLARRAINSRCVYVSQLVPSDLPVEPDDLVAPRTGLRAVPGRVCQRGPGSRLGGILLRPVGDAVITIQTLRIR